MLSYIEQTTPAIYHATPFILSALDRVQDRMILELGMDNVTALDTANLAPLCSRRDIALLGLLHRINLGLAPNCFNNLFYPSCTDHFPRDLRCPLSRHSRQINDPIDASSSALHRRSIFGLIYTYNLLPQKVVDKSSVKKFQSLLQDALKRAASQDFSDWSLLYSTGIRRMSVETFQNLFNE